MPGNTLVLMGLRGSGKSTLARAIGERLDIPAHDLDPLVLERLGAKRVREVWETRGEAVFREAETAALRAALDEEGPAVLALGGGTPMAPGAPEVLRAMTDAGRCVVVYLRLSPEALRERMTRDDPDRPSLTGADVLDEIRAVFEARDPLYRELAEIEHTPECSVERDVSKLIALWCAP